MVQKEVVAVLVSDIHFSYNAPVFRSAEKDWWMAQENQLSQVRLLCEKHRCVLVIGGDIFDDGWRMNRCPPKLINFVIDNLPDDTYAIPGQHDIPHHQIQSLKDSAFWTLVKTGKVHYITPENPVYAKKGITLHGFPWSVPLKPLKEKNILDETIHLAVIHRYLWTKSTGYVGASEETRLSAYKDVLKGYDAVLFGDNHRSVFYNLKKDKSGPSVFNPGSFMIRKSDERDHKPCVGLLHSDGTIKVHYLDCSQDKYLDSGEALQQLESREEMNRLMKELNDTGECGIDFVQAIQTYFRDNDVSAEVKQMILKAVGK